MTLSVIIPVYKAEKTLDKCVRSILSQGVPDMEVILVDDGSPDHCGTMCDQWAVADSRIVALHQDNKGVSAARNIALDIARGEYVTFVDSDDYIQISTYAPLLKKLAEFQIIDIIEFPVCYEGFAHHDRLQFHDCTFSSAKAYWLETKGWNHCYMCNKIFRRNLFDNVRFETGRRLEDMLLLPFIYRKNPVIATTQQGTYNYVCNADSFSNDTSPLAIFQLLRAEWLSAWRMRTMPWSKNGKNLYYYMCCRIYDFIRFSLRDLTKTNSLRR